MVNEGSSSHALTVVPHAQVVQSAYVDPMQQISAIVGLAQEMGFPRMSIGSFHSHAPSFNDLASVFRGNVDHLAPLRQAAQRLMDTEARFRSTRRPLFFPNLRNSWVAVKGAHEAALADCYAIGARFHLSEGTMQSIADRGGLGGYLLSHIAITEHEQKLDAIHAFRRLAEDAAKYTVAVMGAMAQIRAAMQPGRELWRPIHEIAKGNSRHDPDARELSAVRREVLPKYLPHVAKAAQKGRPLIVYPPRIRDATPVVAEPTFSHRDVRQWRDHGHHRHHNDHHAHRIRR